MDGSGNQDGWQWQDWGWQRQQRWAMVAQWVVGWQSNRDGGWDSSGVMDGTMDSGRSPPTQKQPNWRQRKLDSSGNHNGRWQLDHDGQQQRQWALAAQWATGWQSNHNGRWDSNGAMDGAMGGRWLLPTVKERPIFLSYYRIRYIVLSLYRGVFNILKITTTTHNDIVYMRYNSKYAHHAPQYI